MTENGDRHVIVFNGEVYNHIELRLELESLGHVFTGHSDTEVVLKAYIQWGAACLKRFNGMFAFAIFEKRREGYPPKIFLARDRAGKKPLYYKHEKNEFWFASELKAFEKDHTVDLQSLNYYLALGYVPYDRCIAKGFRKLKPAHAAELDLSINTFRTWCYWSLPGNLPDYEVSGEDIAHHSLSLLEDSVRLRLRSDVPVGIFLSGGLDSSLITAVAAKVSSRPVRTFTISVPGTSFDEVQHAKKIAEYFGTEHHVLPLQKPSINILDDLVPFIDEPLADSSILPTFLVSRMTADYVKVSLGGDGGDELFGGYYHYQDPMIDQARIGWVPGCFFRAAGHLASKLPAGVRGRNRISSLRGGPLQSMIWGGPYFDVTLRKRLFQADAIYALGSDINAPERSILALMAQGRDPVDSMTRSDFNGLLPDDYLVKVDRSSMAASLEVRSPFLDYRLIEFTFERIPSAWKLNANERRRIQIIMAGKTLPRDYELKRKQGFSVPMDEWLRTVGPSYLIKSSLNGVLSEEYIDSLIQGHQKGRTNGARLFALIMLELGVQNIGLSV
jgi:asparagine synthase (glutamine-hydrolysing)